MTILCKVCGKATNYIEYATINQYCCLNHYTKTTYDDCEGENEKFVIGDITIFDWYWCENLSINIYKNRFFLPKQDINPENISTLINRINSFKILL